MADDQTGVKPRKQSRSLSPRKEVDIVNVSLLAYAAWKASGLLLRWKTVEEFLNEVMDFKRSCEEFQRTSGERHVITQTLGSINIEINSSLKYVKAYIADMFGAENAQAYYPQFGIVKDKKMYLIPRDNDSRQKALEQLLRAIERHGMAELNYGLGYWSRMHNNFMVAKSEATKHDSSSAGQMSIKTDLKPRIIKTLNALIGLVKVNYPDTWKDELRVWGFQKEKY